MNYPEWVQLMAAILGDLIQLVDNQSYLGQQILNVYYYRVTAVLGIDDGYLPLLNDYWNDNVLPTITQIQVNGLNHNSREWRNISNGVDLFTDGSVVPGDNVLPVSSYLPSYVSMGFLMQRTTLAVRNGYKRYAGIPETFVSGNEYVGLASIVEDVETAIAGDLNIGIASVAEPVIVKRPIVVPVTSYVYSSIDAAQFRGLGTQNTRKAGRGV